MPGISLADRTGSRVTLILDGDLNPLLNYLSTHRVEDLILAPPDLDDIFMGFYGVRGKAEPTASRTSQ